MDAHQGVVFTTVFGQRDALRPPVHECAQSLRCRWVRFTDEKVEKDYQGWENVYVARLDAPPREASRLYKCEPMRWFPEAPWSLWTDATHQWRVDPVALAEGELAHVEIATFGHTATAHEEYAALCDRFPAEIDGLRLQRTRLEYAGFDYGTKLRIGTVVFVRHSLVMQAFGARWCQETSLGGWRDQIALTALLALRRIPTGDFPGSPFFHPWFRYTHHEHDRGTCYPEIWGPFPRKTLRQWRTLLPHELQMTWWQKRLEQYLASWHGRGDAPYQFQYYRCHGCHRLISWNQIRKGGCDCGTSNKLSPTNIRFWEKAQLLLTPWRWR